MQSYKETNLKDDLAKERRPDVQRGSHSLEDNICSVLVFRQWVLETYDGRIVLPKKYSPH